MNGYVYAITDQSYKYIKIGYSKNPKQRIKQLSTGSAKKLYLLTYFTGDRELEKYIHSRYKKVRHNGEWLEVNDELLEYLNSISEDRFIEIDEDGKLRSYLKVKKV